MTARKQRAFVYTSSISETLSLLPVNELSGQHDNVSEIPSVRCDWGLVVVLPSTRRFGAPWPSRPNTSLKRTSRGRSSGATAHRSATPLTSNRWASHWERIADCVVMR